MASVQPTIDPDQRVSVLHLYRYFGLRSDGKVTLSLLSLNERRRRAFCHHWEAATPINPGDLRQIIEEQSPSSRRSRRRNRRRNRRYDGATLPYPVTSDALLPAGLDDIVGAPYIESTQDSAHHVHHVHHDVIAVRSGDDSDNTVQGVVDSRKRPAPDHAEQPSADAAQDSTPTMPGSKKPRKDSADNDALKLCLGNFGSNECVVFRQKKRKTHWPQRNMWWQHFIDNDEGHISTYKLNPPQDGFKYGCIVGCKKRFKSKDALGQQSHMWEHVVRGELNVHHPLANGSPGADAPQSASSVPTAPFEFDLAGDHLGIGTVSPHAHQVGQVTLGAADVDSRSF
ncbi:hypothetical protein BU23DRAFT_564102 [Bimuria novae-zelandiae CBS 107.79]|uniref:Uncharacterized protein n=1 Tax=Bimuria novae-zelandiae CBS 107.79 TaxID=1447943 RepID=A0A6A5VUG6_9PLEO|nr:hypothetical protein BU23DRAFT_564102 [Bimuria novae-zelandiae CBS 107.79]